MSEDSPPPDKTEEMILADPELMQVWILFQKAWDNTEMGIEHLLEIATGLDFEATHVITARVSDNMKIRDIVEVLIKHPSAALIVPKEARIQIRGFCKELEKVIPRRNYLIHARWTLVTTGEEREPHLERVTVRPDILGSMRKGKYRAKKEDIAAFTAELEDLSRRINTLYLSISQQRTQAMVAQMERVREQQVGAGKERPRET